MSAAAGLAGVSAAAGSAGVSGLAGVSAGFPAEFERTLVAEIGAGEAAELLAALNGDPVTSVRFNPFKLSAMPIKMPSVLTKKSEGFNPLWEENSADSLPSALADGCAPATPPGFSPTAPPVIPNRREGSSLYKNSEGFSPTPESSALSPIPWNRYGAYLERRPVFTLDPAMHAGAYYVQEASSQFVEHIVRQAVEEDTEGLRILDLCAAPGGKTTLYSTIAGPGGVVVANEPIRQRAATLADNVRRWGIGNVAVSSAEARDLGQFRHWFDVLAVDAPCSGEGMFRKNRDSRGEWSQANVELCAARQRKILADAWDALRPGGILIYSTCTFNRRENEENVAWLVDNFEVEPVKIDVFPEWGVKKEGVSPKNIEIFRFHPHKLRGEGFFSAVLRKADGRVKRETPRGRREPIVELSRAESRPLVDWVQSPDAMKFVRAGDNCYAIYRPVYKDIVAMAAVIPVIYSGVCMGQIFNGKLRPDHALALFHDLARENLPAVTELTRDEALDYLRKHEFADPSRLVEGLNLLTHNDLPIGWTKRIGHRTNTLLPASFRIVNL
jgi:16S rRNA C967 or C1407 C5-methylase (RsmB/RsmF family)/NOL1/NOP2/fmu family ribosome biogenesis protein